MDAKTVNLEQKWIQLDQDGSKILRIRIGKGRSGRMFLCINKWDKILDHNINFPSILVPTEAYPVVRAMDQLVEEFARKYDNLSKTKGEFPVELACRLVKGSIFDFQLYIFTSNEGSGNKIGFRMEAIHNGQQHKRRWLNIQFRALPWLRHQMADMLARHDGSEQPEPAPEIPQHFLERTTIAMPAEQHHRGSITAEAQQQQSTIGEHVILERRWFHLDQPFGNQLLKIDIKQGKQGHKFVHIIKRDRIENKDLNLPNIRVPQDAYAFVRAMDQLVEELTTAANWQEKLQLAEASPSNHGGLISLACSQVKGTIYDYQLDLFLFNSGRGGNKIGFQMQTIQSVQPHIGRWLVLPFRAFPWLRRQMAEMLAGHDGSQQMGPAPEIPEEILKAQLGRNRQ